MELTLGWKILGVVLVTLGGQTAIAQSDCPWFSRYIEVSAANDITLTSPNYPLDYSNDANCRWQLDTESGYVLKVTFNDFDLENDNPASQTRCPYDRLEFHNGRGLDTKLFGTYCDTVHPEVIFSTGHEMYVEFKSDQRRTFKGFNISISAVEAAESYGMCRVSAGAGKVYWPSGSSGMLYTPDYPIPYPAGTNCFWTITVPPGKRVKLTFEDFELEKNSVNTGYSYNCKYDQTDVQKDHVEIRDGPWSNSRELATYCGNKLDFEFYSTGHQMWIMFRSAADGLRESKGFKAHFVAVEPIVSEELCLPGNTNNDNLKLTGSDGILQSPLVYYPPDLNCDWLITVPEGNTVELSFDRFELDYDGATGACDGDYVDILDGKDSKSKSQGKFCGYTSPGIIRSSGRYMRVRFKSDSNGPVYKGFKATFSAEKKSSSAMLTLAIVILIVVILIVLLVGCILYLVKRKKTPDSEAGATIQMSAITTPATPATQAGVNEHTPSPQVPEQRAETPYLTPSVGYAPGPADPLLSSPERPNTLSENPPPYSGEEVPQYPPPGKSYPWQQA